MNRRTAVAALAACALSVPLAHGQRQGKMWRVGMLSASRVPDVGSHWSVLIRAEEVIR
jgi:hypothetical protein